MYTQALKAPLFLIFCLEVFLFLMNLQTSCTVGLLITIYSFRCVSCLDGCLKQTELLLFPAFMDALRVFCEWRPLHVRLLEVLPQAFGSVVLCSLLVVCVRSLFQLPDQISSLFIRVWEEGKKNADRRMPLAAGVSGPQAVAGFSSLTEIMQVN